MCSLRALFAVALCVFGVAAHGQGALENPVAGSIESGIGIISGWHCSANEITVFVDNVPLGKSGVGSDRGDTAGICGHSGTGFSLLLNYNELTPGIHTISAYADGTLLEARQFNSVRSGGVPYLPGATRDVFVTDFPQPGATTLLRWSQAKQSFVAIGATYQAMPAEGVWTGTTGTSSLVAVVAQSGEYWVLHMRGGYIQGVVHGNGKVSGESFSSTNTRNYIFANTAPELGSIAATVVPGSRFYGSATSSSGAILFDLVYAPDFTKLPNIGNLVGTWRGQSGSLGSISNVTIQIAANGSFTAAVPGGCTYSGALTPHGSGRNIFDMLLSTNAGCATQATVRGVAFQVATELVATGVLPDGSNAFVAIATR